MIKKLFLLSIVVLMGTVIFAQEFPRFDVGVMYTYARFSPSMKYSPSMNLNGGGGSFTYNVNEYIGFKAELMGYGASKATWNIPVGTPVAPNGATVTASGNLFTYLFGPQIRLPGKKTSPYIHALFGAAHTSAFADAISACQNRCVTTAAPSGNAFGMSIGGGLDIPVAHSIALKVGQLDYLLTRFNNQLTTNNHNNFRYSAGIIFRFGSGSH